MKSLEECLEIIKNNKNETLCILFGNRGGCTGCPISIYNMDVVDGMRSSFCHDSNCNFLPIITENIIKHLRKKKLEKLLQ